MDETLPGIEIYDLGGYDGNAPDYRHLNCFGEFPISTFAEVPDVGDFVVFHEKDQGGYTRLRIRFKEWMWMPALNEHPSRLLKVWLYADLVIEEGQG